MRLFKHDTIFVCVFFFIFHRAAQRTHYSPVSNTKPRNRNDKHTENKNAVLISWSQRTNALFYGLPSLSVGQCLHKIYRLSKHAEISSNEDD